MKLKARSFFNRFILILPIILLLANLAVHQLIPDKQKSVPNTGYYSVFIAFTLIYAILLFTPKVKEFVRAKITYLAPLFSAVAAVLLVWDIITLKMNLLILPYFPGFAKIIYSAFVQDWQVLGGSLLASLRLMSLGFVLGTLAGLATGILIGWSRRGNYWLGPVIKILGPIPATTWIPIAMTVFPSSFYARVFLVVLAVWFPVTVLTSSGIANVSNSYFEVAKTLGASKRYMIFHVAIPAASPMIFLSLYAAIGTAFATLLGAEVVGAKSGLGWYIAWHSGWAEYAKVYGALFVIAVMASVLIYVLFQAKDRMMVWQKGLIKW
jgi:NitT/TauT family transport system permease protein